MYAARDDARARAGVALIASIAICLALATGCGGKARRPARSASSAGAGVDLVIAALHSDDPARAYALLSADVRQQIDYEQFASRWKETAAERRERARELQGELQAAPSLGERALVTLADGSTVYLIREGDVWRLESPLLSSLRADHPRETLRLLAQALTTHDYEALMRVVTERRRTAIGDLVEHLAASLTQHLQDGTESIEVLDEGHSELRWDDGDVRYKIVLHKENGEWRVDDVHIRSHADEPAETERE